MAKNVKKEHEGFSEKLVQFIQGNRLAIMVAAIVVVIGVIAFIVANGLSSAAIAESSASAETLDTRLAEYLASSTKVKDESRSKLEEFKAGLGEVKEGPAKDAMIAEKESALKQEEKAAIEELRTSFSSELASIYDSSSGYLKARAAYLESYLALESYASNPDSQAKLDAAIASLKKHIDTGIKAPETGSVYLSLGSMLERKGDIEGAVGVYRSFIARFEETRIGQGGVKEYKISSALVPEAYFRIGAAMDELGDSAKAVSEGYEALVERYPDSQWTKLASDLILLAKGRK